MKSTHRTGIAVVVAGALAAGVTMAGSAASPRFYHDDPIRQERDTEDASGMKPLDVDLLVDLTANMLNRKAGGALVRAQNVNTVDEVPDSGWYANRAGARPLTPDDVFRGPDTTDGPE